MEVVVLYIAIAVAAVVVYKNRRKVDMGVIKTASGKLYPYAIGNYLQSEAGSFNGLEVTLPYTLANFYLDSHKDSKRKGPAAMYDKGQMLSLEGDFNKYFQLFVPTGSANVALSVLSPDVMHTLVTSVQRFDVELSGNYLRIITLEKTSKLTGGPLLTAAEAVIQELDHRAKSWQPGDTPAKLACRRGTAVKLGGRYFRRSRAIAAVLLVLLLITGTGLGLALYYTHQDPAFSNPYSKGFWAGTVMYLAEGIVLTAIPVAILSPVVWFLRSAQARDVFPGNNKHL